MSQTYFQKGFGLKAAVGPVLAQNYHSRVVDRLRDLDHVARAGDVGKTSHGGLAAGTNDALVMYTYGGDANLSGNVDADDYFAIDSNYGHYNKTDLTLNAGLNYAKGDFNLDGIVNGDDFAIIDAGYVGQGAAFAAGAPAGAQGGVTAVPEPGTFAVVSLAAMSLLSRRRRK